MKRILLFAVLLMVQLGFGQVETFTTSGSFTVPCGVTSITVEAWGGGGAGGGAIGDAKAAGGGGGAGAYRRSVLAVTPGSVIAYTVGAGGTGGTGNGGAGGTTTFSTVSANGGNGGIGGNSNNGTGGTGGTGGTYNGGNGINAALSTYGGGGGSSAGSVSNGNNGSGSTGGIAVTDGGAGGNGGIGSVGSFFGFPYNIGVNGSDGTRPGGGGGGADRGDEWFGLVDRSGGAGANGQVRITYLATPGPISGTVAQCPAQTGQVYSITAIPNATSYSWTVPAGWSITAGSTTNTITVTTGTAGQNGNITVRANKSCGTPISGGIQTLAVTVNSRPTVTFTAQPGATACSNTNVTYTTQSGQTNYVWVVPGTLGTDYSISSGGIGSTSNTVTLQWLTAGSKTVTINYTGSGGCTATAATSSTATTVTLRPTAPTIGTITHPTCTVATGTFQIIAFDSARTYTFTPAVLSISGTGLVSANPDTYSFTVDNASGCISLPTSVTIDPQQLKTWTGTTSTDWNVPTNWSPAGIPTTSDCVVIPNVTNKPIILTTGVDANANTLQVDANASLTINSLRTLTVVDKITVAGSGTLTFEDRSSLVQDAATTTNSNSGEITYKRISKPMENFDFTYWSSPVANQNIVALSPNTLADKYFRWDPVNGWIVYNNPTTSTMIPGAGYIIRVPKPNFWPVPTDPSWEQPVAFKGVPNNGDVTFGVKEDEYNLIGNPYPSALNATKFMQDNSGIIYGSLYFWTHNTPITNNIYTSNDYATFNLTGPTATGNFNDINDNGQLDPGEENTANRPTGYIAAGQSFFVGSQTGIPANSKFIFKNSQRDVGNNDNFFKQTSAQKTTAVEKNRVWLNLTNSGGAFKQLLVGYITGATNDWDNLYDGPTFDGQEFVDFYSINQGKNLTIQGRAVPFETTDEVPLGYRSTIAGDFDISIDTRDGQLATQEIWLEDKKTNTLHELSKGKYTFTAINGVENDRFVLKYTGKTLGTDDNEVADKSLIVSVKNKKITLTSSAEAIAQVQVFDLLGRKVYDKSKINAQEWSISNLPSSEQTLIVKTTLANGAISNKKIIY